MAKEKSKSQTNHYNPAVLAALSAVPFIMVLGNSMLIPVLPKMKSIMDLSQFQCGLIITAFSIPAGLGLVLAGPLSDCYGRKTVIAPSLILYGLGGVLAGLSALFFANPYYPILGSRVLQGLAAAGTYPVAMALAGDLFQGDERSKSLGLLEAANGLGKVASPILGAATALLAWYFPFFVYAVLSVPAALAIWFLIDDPGETSKSLGLGQYFQKVKGVFATKAAGLIAMYLAGTVILFLLFGLLFYFSDTLEAVYKIFGFKKGLVLAIPVLVMSITSFIMGRIVHKKVNLMKTLTWVGLTVSGLGLLSLGLIKAHWYLFLAVSIVGFGNGLALPSINYLITSSTTDEKRGTITSLYGGVRFFGVALGPPLFGLGLEWSKTGLFISAGILGLIIAGLVLLLVKPKEIVTKDSAS